jgi:RNA polymerase sigma-70 factor (ECF subfamily)
VRWEPFRTLPPLEDVTDHELIRAARSGDGLALSELMDVLAPFVGRLCGPIALDHGPDAAQEALIQIFRDLHTLREPGALMGWVRRIAIREAIRHARRARKEVAFDPQQSPDPSGHSALPAADDPALARDVRRVLEALAPEQRAILVLRDLEGLSEHEAAQQLEIAKGTAKSRLHRARSAFIERWNA